MTAPRSPSADHIDFDALTDRFRILPTSHRWSAVLMSMDRLESVVPGDRRKPEFQDDVLNVQGFAANIRTHSRLIACSIACAAALARFGRVGERAPNQMDPGPDEESPARFLRVYRALETLSLAYRFTAMSSDAVLSLLDSVWNGLDAYGGLPKLEFPPVKAAADVQRYFEAFQSVLTQVQSLGPITNDILAAAETAAWDSVNARYEDIVRGRSERAPHVAECVCRMADVLPASTLAFSVRDTPATAWANLVMPTAAVKGKTRTPASALVIACHALGFRATDRSVATAMFEYFNGLMSSPEKGASAEFNRDVIAFLARNEHVLSRPPLQQAVFVIRRETDSLVTRWPTCENVATLPLTRPQVQAMLGGRYATLTRTRPTLPDALRSPKDCSIAIEYPPDAQDTSDLAEGLRALISTQPRKTDSRVLTVGFGSSDSRYDREAFIPSPTRYEDLVPASLFSRSRSQMS